MRGAHELKNPSQVFWSQLAFFLMYSCFFISLCSPLSCLVIAVASSPQTLLQCFARRGSCLCQPTITFPAEMAKSFLFSWCFSDIYFTLNSFFENIYSILSKATFWTVNRCTMQPKVVTTQFFIFFLLKVLLLMFVLFVNPCWRKCSYASLNPALYKNMILLLSKSVIQVPLGGTWNDCKALKQI